LEEVAARPAAVPALQSLLSVAGGSEHAEVQRSAADLLARLTRETDATMAAATASSGVGDRAAGAETGWRRRGSMRCVRLAPCRRPAQAHAVQGLQGAQVLQP
jgi:hypothetical protein